MKMLKTRKKWISLLVTLTFLLTLFPMALPAFAASTNKALTVPSFTAGNNRDLGTIRVQESYAGEWAGGFQVIVTLPEGVEYATPPAALAGYVDTPRSTGTGPHDNSLALADLVFNSGTAKTLVFTVPPTTLPWTGAGQIAFFDLLFNNTGTNTSAVNVTAAAGDIEVDILETSGQVTSGKVMNARVVSAGTTATALTKPSVSKAGGQGFGTIRIIENNIGALNADAAGTRKITVPLPDGFTWDAAPVVTPVISGGGGTLAVAPAAVPIITDSQGRSQYVFDVTAASTVSPGIIDLSGWNVSVSDDVDLGDVAVKIGGSAGASADSVVIAKVVDYGVKVSAKTTPELFAGRYAAEIGRVVLEETAAGSLLPNRTIKLTLPEGAAWRTVPNFVRTKGDVLAVTAAGGVRSRDNRTITYTLAPGAGSTAAATIEFRDGEIDIKGNCPAGELFVKVEGNAGAAGEAAVANILAPVTVEASEVLNVGIGLMSQPIGDITITEVKDGAAVANPAAVPAGLVPGQIIVRTPFDGMTWSGTPTVTVEEGNIKLDKDNITTGNNGRDLIIPVRTSSTTASTIKISNAKVTLDRTVPYGAQSFGIRGSALDWAGNATLALAPAGTIVSGSSVATVVAAKAATPAPGETISSAVFTVGSAEYTVDGVAKSMDAAPYIKDSRTFLPMRFVGEAVGVPEDNILWAGKTATFMKGDRIVQVTIGSKDMLVNGAKVEMDVAPEILNGRTMLPIRWVGIAFGADLQWDNEAKSVTVN